MTGERYEKMHRIASGGLSDVYLGRKRGEGGFERLVALKIMHPELTRDRDLVRVFLDQARIAASVRHPNVVPVLDVEAEGSTIRFIMEYVEGTSLEKLVATSSAAGVPISIDAALRIVQNALAGLQAIHELEGPGGVALGIIHYNLTPRSLLIGADGTTRITDFGVDPKHLTGAISSPDERRLRDTYSAPEALAGGPMDARSDLFSIGVLLWELLANRDYPSAAGASRPIPPPPSSINASLPRAFDEVCQRLLVSDPAERFASAEEVISALAEVADATGVRLATVSTIARLVHDSEDEQPTRMKRSEEDALASASGSTNPELDTMRGPLETVPLDTEQDDPGTFAPRSEMGTVRMEWPSAQGRSIRDSDSDVRTMMAPVMHAPRAPLGEPLAAALPAVLPVFEDRSTPVPAGLERAGGGAVKLVVLVGALLAALTIGWFIRELAGGDEAPAPAASSPVRTGPPPAAIPTIAPLVEEPPAAESAPVASASVSSPPPSSRPPPSSKAPPSSRPPPTSWRRPPKRPPPPAGSKSIIRDAPF